MTLVEITLAIAIFAILMGVAAQALISWYAALELQSQRTVAVQALSGVLSDIRQLRDNDPDGFPENITEAYPDVSTVELPTQVLSQQNVQIRYVDTTANPLEIVLTMTWNDPRGRQATLRMGTLLTDR